MYKIGFKDRNVYVCYRWEFLFEFFICLCGIKLGINFFYGSLYFNCFLFDVFFLMNFYGVNFVVEKGLFFFIEVSELFMYEMLVCD